MSPARRSLVSLVVIALSAAATYAAWRMRPPPPPPLSALLTRVFDFPASAVRAIEVESWQGALRARREDGGWRVELVELRGQAANPSPAGTPTPAEVDQTLDTLVQELVELPEIDRFPLGNHALAEFGLAQPQARVTLELDSGERRALELGDLTVTTSALYGRVVPSDDVVQVGTLVFNDLAAALYRLRALAAAPARGTG